MTMTIKNGKKTLFDGFGEMLFTHFGISGPLGLSASSYIGKALEQQPLKGYLNLKPALTEEQLDARILREFEENRNKTVPQRDQQSVPGETASGDALSWRDRPVQTGQCRIESGASAL